MVSFNLRRALAGLFVACLAMFAVQASAQVPRTLAYQGFLVSSAGEPVNTTLSITFRLYDAAQGGSPLWSETQQVAVSRGAYSVTLGSVNPLAVAFDKPYFVGVSVGSDAEMLPRQALSSVPYALRAGCFPGDRLTCFSGGASIPPGCQAGVRICNADGSGFGMCEGEIVPNCGGNCVNLQTDVNNCGQCGRACTFANAASSCSAGTCQLQACNLGFASCDGLNANGCEVNVRSDPQNCGSCGNSCSAGRSCVQGACI